MTEINYAKMPSLNIKEREWPSRLLADNPAWCAVDLRDGNQALPNPMTAKQKREYFKLLTEIGFKEIEIGFPSASDEDFQFCRDLIEENLIPDDVIISVLTQARPHLIERTMEALKGVKRGVVHFYIATSELHMKYVFNLSEESVLSSAIAATRQIKELAARMTDSSIGLEFSPEEFSDTDLGYAIDICKAVVEEWAPVNGEKVILNLPMTVERRMPNDYADMIEEFIRRFPYKEKSIISLHVHNDMGCAVAATMQALLAGAQRVEGTLFGHGERTGNVDLVTVANNLEYLGINTGLKFSNLPGLVDMVEDITNMKVHPRHPYAGELVFTAFSGSHQDAIRKGFIRRDELHDRFCGWKIPYLHVSPEKLGRRFEHFIRINSQSGKGGIAYVLQQDYHIDMPRWMQVDFSKYVQKYAEDKAREVAGAEIYELFRKTYVVESNDLQLINYWPRPTETEPKVIEGELHINFKGALYQQKAVGNGPISAFVAALSAIPGISGFTLEDYVEDSLGTTADAEAICFIRIKSAKDGSEFIGVGFDLNTTQAAAKAVISAINRLIKY